MKKIFQGVILLMFYSTLAIAQQREITGKVLDENGQPVSGASVVIKGTNKGTSADLEGNFRISAKTGDVLVVSAVGTPAKEIKVSTGTTYSVSLARQIQNLSEAIVTTALGVRRQAKELGYATTSVSNKVLTQGRAVNVQQALNGKVSGLSVTTTNSSVFENAKINIRGIRSLTGNNQPMLVVDGAPTPLGYLSSIPPSDIQELTILKSAASAAVYGPDAVNGVIVVTTKRGTANALTVSYTSSVQLARVAFFPKLQKSFGAGAGEVLDQYGNFGYVPYENQQYGPAFDGTMKPIGVALEDGSIQNFPYTNAHYKDKIKFWNTGLTFQNSISLSGQDFYAGIDDANIKGLTPDDKNRRTSFRFNGGKTYGKLSVNYGLNYVLQNYDIINENALPTLSPSYNGSLFFLVMQTANNVPLISYKDWRNSKFAQYSNYYNEYAVNPYWAIGNLRTVGREDDLIGNIDVNYQVAPWIKASVKISSNLAFANSKSSTAPVVVTDWAAKNRNPTQFSNRPGAVADDENFTSRINFDYFLSGERDINKDFTIKYLAGGTIRQNRSKDVAVGGTNLVVPFLYNVSTRSGDANVPTYGTVNNDLYPDGNYNYNVQTRLLSAYGTLGLGYKGYAFLELTGRNDWDSRLLQQNRSFFYPAANASFILSDAIPSIKNNGVINYAKVRAAYSKSGNVNISPYALQATFEQSNNSITPSGFPYGNVVGYTANATIPSPNLKPEFVITKEVGVELGLLKNRIDVGATYFYQNCNNQILQVSQSATTGYTFGLANAASFKNYGVEMDLGLSPLFSIGKGRIDFKFNATYNNNEVTNTLNNIPVVVGGNNYFIQNSVSSPTANNIAIVGRPAFAFQLTDYLRDSTTGKVIVDPVTGMPSQAAELVNKGRSLPLWVLGFTPSYSVGNFSISMTWDYKSGHNFYSGLGSDEDFAGISARSAEYGRQRFVFPNSVYYDGAKYVPNTNILVQDGNYGFWTGSATNTGIGTNYYASAASWRLREVNISYNIPQRWIGNGKVIKRLTLSAVGRNLFLFVPKSNQWGDPEFNYSSTGNTYGLSSAYQSPSSRLFGGSLTVQF
ncbi:SusC/RagA family TonB-linked outer membrane protein [Segetibacter koreensis]|uniref:SusC/RagA family TonB-linked outer membrane protein n=1 Tax=Segetibacter koreensis TaxID=398037 RepID=UPI00036931DA|nr:SusC/RagA family TonB-linked outer membrane protein [Segetibacter koreensis]